MPTAIIRLVKLGPSTATIPSARRMPGKSSITSTTRIRTTSTQPTVVPGEQSKRHAWYERGRDGDGSDKERDAASTDDPAEDVAPVLVAAEEGRRAELYSA